MPVSIAAGACAIEHTTNQPTEKSTCVCTTGRRARSLFAKDHSQRRQERIVINSDKGTGSRATKHNFDCPYAWPNRGVSLSDSLQTHPHAQQATGPSRLQPVIAFRQCHGAKGYSTIQFLQRCVSVSCVTSCHHVVNTGKARTGIIFVLHNHYAEGKLYVYYYTFACVLQLVIANVPVHPICSP